MANVSERQKQKRFLFTVSGGYGHLHPLVPLARALQQAGHTVAVAVGPALEPVVARTGFEVLPMGGTMKTDPEYEQFKALQQTMPVGLETELFTYPRLFCGIGSRVRTPFVIDVAKRWKPDMIIREAGQYSAVIAAEYLGLPHATVAYAAALQTMTVFEREAAAYLDPVRQSWGLAPDPGLASLYRYLNLCYSPPSLATQDVSGPLIPEAIDTTPAPLPATTHFVRPDFFSGDESLPGWMDSLPRQPTVYVTLGTEVNTEPDLYPAVLQTIVSGLRELPVNLIVTLGRGKDPADFGLQPSNVHVEQYIPQSVLLPRCDVMVMHAGSNSLLQAIDAGVPLVLVPLIADQFFNASAAQRLMLGKIVSREHLTGESIREAVEEVLRNPVYRENIGRLRTEMQALPDISYAVSLVERVAATREPVPNALLEAAR